MALKILIIDDEADMRAAIKDALIELKANFIEASDGQEGLEKLKEHSFDCIITDLKMPNMDGVTFIKNARKTFKNPIVVVTGFGTRESIEECLKYGINDFIDKLSFSTILETIQSAIGCNLETLNKQENFDPEEFLKKIKDE
ncbi:MAG: response regulator [Bacteriovoracaceae bacterium]